MPVPDDSALLHGRPYDAAKAHEYYLRTRQLKGRHPGATPSGHGVPQGAKLSAAQAQHKELEQKKLALEARLNHLKSVLSDLVAAAKARSGIEPANDSTNTTKDTPQATADKNQAAKKQVPLTAKQKRDKAEAEKKAYQKEHPPLPKELESLQKQINEIHQKIKLALADAQNKYAKVHSLNGTQGR